MPRGKKSNQPISAAAAATVAATASNLTRSGNRSATSKARKIEVGPIDELFYRYANTSSKMIDPDGIERLCTDMGVDHTDVRILMLAWKMQATQQGYFTFEEWCRGVKGLKADTPDKLRKALPGLEDEARKTSNFTDFYSYAFRYCLTDDKQKCIDIESICQLLQLIMKPPFPAQINSLVEYLKVQTDYKVLNMDQWMGFYRFCNEISFPDLSNYNDADAWPSVLDNFVDWIKAK